MQRYSKLVKTLTRGMSSFTKIEFTTDHIRSIIPPLTNELHKGQCGTIGVIGGSREYTGAPYFAAMSTLRLGGDLAHVFCCDAAGTAIKGYSPDLIVHPILDDDNVLEQIKKWLPRLHAVVVGPGLGRDPVVMKKVECILSLLSDANKITVLDADGLHIVTEKPEIMTGFQNLIITPNAIEYERLVNATKRLHNETDLNSSGLDILLSNFKNLTIVKKGPTDQIFHDGYFTEVVGGSACRCGGQGDVLSGSIALFSYWSHLAGVNSKALLGAYAGCYFTRHLNAKVFEERGRSMVTGDFIERIGHVFNECFSTN